MTSDRSVQTGSPKIGSPCSEELDCLTVRAGGALILPPVFMSADSARFSLHIQQPGASTNPAYSSRSFDPIEEIRLNPHSVELGGRFSTLRF
jgi:hypothetical protein